jgi:hypothetical protein
MASFGKLVKKLSIPNKSNEGKSESRRSSQETVKTLFGTKLGAMQTRLAAGHILGMYTL